MELFTPKFIICLLFCAVAHHQLAFVEARPQFISPEEAPAQAPRIAASDGEQPPEKAEQAAQPVDQDQQQEEPNGKPTSAGETKIEGPKEVQDQTPLKAPVSEGETQPPSNDEGQVKEPAAETTAAEKSPPAEAAPPMVVNDGEPPGVSRAYQTIPDQSTFGETWKEPFSAIYVQTTGPLDLWEFRNKADADLDYVNQLAKHQNAVVLLIEYREIHMFGPTTVTDKGRTVTPLVLDDFQDFHRASFLSTEYMAKDVDGVIKGLRQKLQKLGRLATNAPAIAFGAGQRGLLAKWLLDADVVDFAVVSSVPFIGFPNAGAKLGDYDHQLTAIFENSGGCNRTVIRAYFDAVDAAVAAKDFAFLNAVFNLELAPLREDDPDLPGKVEDLKAYMKQRLVEMADLNFNYEKPEVFMKGRKAYPIKVFCEALGQRLETNTTYSTIDAYKPLLQRVSNAYRATFTEPDIVTPSYQEDIRPCPFNTPDCVKTRAEKTALFLECTELAEFRCAGANNDDYVFYRECSSEEEMLAMLKAKCQRGLPGIFNKTTVDRVSTRFVSANHPFKPDELKNIVITVPEFSTNKAVAGVDSTKTDPEKQVFVFELPNAVTGQDLATPNTCEPLGVSKQRAMLAKILKCWVHNAVKNTTVNTKANTDNNSQQQPKSGAESAKSGEMDEMCRSLTTEGLDRRAPFPAEDCAPIEDKYPWWLKLDRPTPAGGAKNGASSTSMVAAGGFFAAVGHVVKKAFNTMLMKQ